MRGDNSDETGQMPSLVALSHELKAPLALMRQIAMASEHYSETERETAFERIRLTAERSLRLTEALTRSYRTEELESEPINLGRLCDEVALELTPLCRELGQDISVKTPKQSILAVGNRELVSSVIFGLCDNALNYGQAAAPIELKIQRDGDDAKISVRDYGPSLLKSELAKIKSKLGNSPQAVSSRPGSSGLGLYIASQFAQAMDGQLGVTSHKNGGQTFFIHLPQSFQMALV
ncbi:MAG: HAMP domain-containing sensor histidine kinase [Candidatus Saccharibacteria bacterium]|nr:HAMP domain-containing sensor histidine kinase [Candidatus Saccharibacteria bacterium]